MWHGAGIEAKALVLRRIDEGIQLGYRLPKAQLKLSVHQSEGFHGGEGPGSDLRSTFVLIMKFNYHIFRCRTYNTENRCYFVFVAVEVHKMGIPIALINSAATS